MYCILDAVIILQLGSTLHQRFLFLHGLSTQGIHQDSDVSKRHQKQPLRALWDPELLMVSSSHQTRHPVFQGWYRTSQTISALGRADSMATSARRMPTFKNSKGGWGEYFKRCCSTLTMSYVQLAVLVKCEDFKKSKGSGRSTDSNI